MSVVPDTVVADLEARADSESGLHRIRRAPLVVAGVSVRIARSVLSGLEDMFEREAGRDRVLLLLNVLGQRANVRVPAGCVVSNHAP